MPTKNTKKKAVRKPAARKPVVMPAKAPVENAGCGCAACKGGHVLRNLVWIIIVFAAGFATCHFGCCNRSERMMPQMNFVNGCLDVSEMQNRPMMAEKLILLDANKDGCIDREEAKEMRNVMRNQNQGRPDIKPQGTAPSPDLESVEE